MVIVPWSRMPQAFRLAPPLALAVVCVLIRRATGGSISAYGQLALVPVLWLAAYALAWEVAAGCAGVTIALAVSLGLSHASASEYPSVGLLILEALVLAMGVQRLFAYLRHHQDQLILLAGTDPLTGAANRRGWDEELETAITAASTDAGTVSIAMIDVDHFKAFNDSRGHQAGDRLLKELVARWRSQLRESDLLARVGGDEFAVVLPGCPKDPAERIVLRLTEGVPYQQTCSTGIACWEAGESAADLVARADAALYCSKEAGRNRVTVA
jgi:diguanylate cyclase (GGDEF)-like protein